MSKMNARHLRSYKSERC